VSQALAAKPIDGQWREWNRRWPAIGAGPNRCLWTAGRPETTHQRRFRAYWSLLLEEEPKPDWSCIELGSGRGTISQYLAAMGCTVTLVDLAAMPLEIARDNFAKAGLPPPQTLTADCQHTKLKRESFELAHSVGLLEHFEDPGPTVFECRRLLKKGGLMWHVIVGGDGAGSDIKRIDRQPAQYLELAQQAGFADARCRALLLSNVYLLTGRRT